MNNSTSLQNNREKRAAQPTIVPGTPALPGIRAAMELSPELGHHLRGLADTLLVKPFPGSSLTRFEAELLATRVSAANGCYFCMDSHACHAVAIANGTTKEQDAEGLAEDMKLGIDGRLEPRLRALVRVALNVQSLNTDFEAERADVETAQKMGANDGDIQHTVAIASAFSMYNRLVEGLGAITPSDTSVYKARASQVAQNGYQQ